MFEFVADKFGEDGSRLRSFYCVAYEGGELPPLPWGDERFDCVLVVADPDRVQTLGGAFAEAIVRCNVDYVQTTGEHAEFVHDRIDWASVAAGVQDAVGDGHPMTSWHEDARTLDAMGEVAALCLGGHDWVLCAFVGRDVDRRTFVEGLRRRLASGE